MAIEVTKEGVAKLGTTVQTFLKQFMDDRVYIEKQMLKNLRQYQGKYDPEVKKLIPSDRSHAYPRDTRTKVKGGVAKMMEMMFPAKENNWELAASEVPSIPEDNLQAIITQLEAQEEALAVQEQREPAPLDSADIEREVKLFAEERKEAMQKEIADQLGDEPTDYPQLSKRVVRSGYIYGWGVARSPMVRTQTERVWELDEDTQSYEAKTKTEKRPYPEFVRAWDCYPDLSAKIWEDQERFFEAFTFVRHDLAALGKRSDFDTEAIRNYLRENQEGNYTAKNFESELHELAGTSSLTNINKRRYQVYRHLGFISAHELVAAGVEVEKDKMAEDILADVWIIDDKVIKAEVAAFGERPCGIGGQYHAFIYAEDEDAGLTGQGLPEEVRDTQMGLCASTRAMFDNMAATAGPVIEVNDMLLARGSRGISSIHAFKVIHRDDESPTTTNSPAVRFIDAPNHVPTTLSIIQQQRQQLDVESNLPAWTFGDMTPLGEGVRTSFNMSQMTGGANMVTKDTVRAFDRFTSSLIGSFLAWNMEFNKNEDLKGDFQVRAKGNLSLVAREVRGAALDQFMTTLSPEERAILDVHGIMIDRLKARDLPTDRVLPRDEAMQVLNSMSQAAAEATQIDQGLTKAKTANADASSKKTTTDAEMTAASAESVIQEILSRVEANLAQAKSSGDKTQLENFKQLLEAGKNELG